MSMAKGKLVEGGRIIVPAAFRRAMGIAKGDTVVMELHGDEPASGHPAPPCAVSRSLSGRMRHGPASRSCRTS